METARQRLQEIPNQLKAANDGYRQKLSLYKSGLTDIIELDAALNILYRAETDYVQAKYAYTNALIPKGYNENQVNTILNLIKIINYVNGHIRTEKADHRNGDHMSLLIFAVLSAINIPIDIFPKLNLPTIYVIESYGGMSPQQMEGFFSTRMQDQFLYVNGVKNITSKNIQGLTMIKLTFYESTNMAEASAQVALQVNRAKVFPARRVTAAGNQVLMRRHCRLANW